ncbi:MAG: DNA repair protein RecN [Clostridia bacterium]|nr:DNA repair protein RecN [Clostridia bacterium]
MLQTLSIKNVALITKLSIEFSKGFNVFLGETGAGKSIIFDSLNFVLGGKADKTLIRSGENEMRVDALFSDLSQQVQENLAELGFDGDEIMLSRTLNLDGRSTIRVNAMPATQSILKTIGAMLVDCYSQHESVDLLKSKNHLSMLDKFGGEIVALAKHEVATIYNKEKEISHKINEFGGDEFERERMASLLEYQIQEIEGVNLQVGEDEQLQEKLKLMQNAEKIYEVVGACEGLLSDGMSSCLQSLQQSSSFLASLSQFDEVCDCKERLDSARYEIEDIVQTLNAIKDNADFDEREFEKMDRRLDEIKRITKKYGGSIENAIAFLEQAKEKFNNLQDSEFMLAKLQKEKDLCRQQLISACEKLTEIRKSTAKEIERKIVEELKQLGMKSSMFEVSINQLTEPTANGNDNVEFIFSANKGQELKSLSKTASGGELSRFMLAVKTIFAKIGGAQTLVFDEIDSGISGETGNIVGCKLAGISKDAQVLCITHLPQVASHANAMYFVSKKEVDNSTFTQVSNLNEEEIIQNLAKMVVGENLTETAILQAKEMRDKALNK